jgi:hypothetical protein
MKPLPVFKNTSPEEEVHEDPVSISSSPVFTLSSVFIFRGGGTVNSHKAVSIKVHHIGANPLFNSTPIHQKQVVVQLLPLQQVVQVTYLPL